MILISHHVFHKTNYFAIELTIEKHNVILLNIDGPNRDDPEFYKKVHRIVEQFKGNLW